MKTPKQILIDNPEIKAAGYTTQDLGYLYRLGIVQGLRIKVEVLLNEKQVLKWFKTRFV